MITETELFEHALIGLEFRKRELDRRIEELRQRTNATAPAPPRRKRHPTPEGRANIVAALKRRWAERKRQQRAKGR